MLDCDSSPLFGDLIHLSDPGVEARGHHLMVHRQYLFLNEVMKWINTWKKPPPHGHSRWWLYVDGHRSDVGLMHFNGGDLTRQVMHG